MAIKVKFDLANNPLPLRLILATRSGNRIRELPLNEIKFHDTMMSGSEISFRVYKNRCVDKNGNIDEGFWRRITDLKLAYCPEFDMWYELDVDIDETSETVKSVTAKSLGEAELSQTNLYEIEINTEDDIAREDYVPTVFYNPENEDASLLHRMLKKVPHYRIAHVDESIAGLQRTFQFNDKSISDAFNEVAEEIDCLFMLDCVKGTDTKIDRTVSVYDLESHCPTCGARGDFTTICEKCGATGVVPGYGKDTSIFVSRENLAQEVTFTTDKDSVKNCFRLEAGDDYMTAAIVACNPNGSRYLWYIPDETMEDMSSALRSRIESYNVLYDDYQNTHVYTPDAGLVSQYNTIVSSYTSYDETLQPIPASIVGFPALMTAYYNTVDLQHFLNSSLMPNVVISPTTAADEAAKLTAANLSPVAVAKLSTCSEPTAANAVLGMAKCYVAGSYQVKVNASAYNASTHTWTGNFTVTNYSDEDDTADSSTISVVINENLETSIQQKIQKTMSQTSDEVTDVSELFKLTLVQFQAELRKYSMQRLISFRDCAQAALSIMIQQGVPEDQTSTIYVNLYTPYREKAEAIEYEILVRTGELAVVAGVRDDKGGVVSDGMQTVLAQMRSDTQDTLNFEAYLGSELWNEFASFRREDTFSNSNYISDGLDNATLFARAMEFVEIARKEIYKSAKLQHSITAKLADLLAIGEFRPIVNDFALGNWIRVLVDGIVYRLRLSEYEIDYNKFDLSVVFTDVREGYSSASDISSLLSAMKSMQTSYGAVSRQAKDGKESATRLKNWSQEGFSLTTKIVGGAENQEFIMDENGLTGREYIPETESYSDEQIKVIANGLYVTDDGWQTTRAGIGKFIFWNPATSQYETRFGVIADTVVAPIILSQDVGVYNDTGDIKMDENGLTIIADATNNQTVFRIQRRDGQTLTDILSIDGNGNLVLSNYATKANTISDVDVEYAVGASSSTAPSSGWSTNTPVWSEGSYVWQRTKTTDGNGSASYSDPVCIQGADGPAGSAGLNTATVFLYKRAESASGITKPTSTLTYTFATGVLSGTLGGWSQAVPATDGNPCFMIQATAIGSGTSDTIASGEWSSITKFVEDGEDGVNGRSISSVKNYYLATNASSGVTRSTAGWTEAVQTITSSNKYLWNYEEVIYSSGNPSYTDPTIIGVYGEAGAAGRGITSITEYYAKSGSNTTAPADNSFTTTMQTVDATDKYLWNRELVTYTDGTSAWTSKRVIGMFSEDGADGYNAAVIYLYKRSATAATIDWQTTLTYTFSTNTLSSIPSGWSTSIPSGTDPAYVTAATAHSQNATVDILYTQWAAPIQLVKNGEDGLNTATVFLYQRAASASGLTKPGSTLTYTFATGILSGTLGNWSQTVPASDGNPCFTIQATAIGSGTTDAIASSEWSAITKFVEDGVDGAAGKSISSVKNYYLATSASSGVTRSTSGWTEAVQTITSTNKYLWNYEEITYSYGDPSYTTPVIIGAYGETGDTGKGITSITEYYAKSGSNTTAPADSSFVTTMQTVDATDKYLWNRELIAYTDNTTAWTSKRVIGMFSEDGEDGYNTAVIYLYKRSATAATVDWQTTLTYTFATNSLSSIPSGWSTSIPSGTNPAYVTAATAHSKDSSVDILYTQWASPIQLVKNGEDGIGVDDMEEQYYLSTSVVTQTGGEWTAEQPIWEYGKYIWTRTKTDWTDGTTTYTDPVLASAINDANISTYNLSVEMGEMRQEFTSNYISGTEFAQYKNEASAAMVSTAQGVVESYNYTQQINNLVEANKGIVSQITSIDGEIRRGYIPDPDPNHAGQLIFGIAVSEKLKFESGTQTVDGVTYYQLSNDQTFGFYTSTGWQYWIGGQKVGWFDSNDRMLHVDNMVAETSITIGSENNGNQWNISTANGFGIKFSG